MGVGARAGFIGKMVQRSNYAYANARVRVRKSRLLPPDTYPKLLQMEIPEITRFIAGTEYGREVEELASKFSGIDLLENSLNVNEERTFAEIRNFARGAVGLLVERYLERYNWWNIKTILRGRRWGAPAEEIQRELLIETRDDYDFYSGLVEADGTGLRPVVEALATHPKGLAAHKVLRDVESRQGEELLLQHMEDALDRAYYSRLLETIPGNDPDSRLFLHFVRKEIDTVNLGVILRFEWRDDPSTRVLEFTTPGGLHLGESDLRRLAEANTRAELLERLKEYPVYEELKDALAAAQESGSLVPVEIALKRGLADYAQRFAHRNPLSVLPIVNYLLRKHYEVRNLRAIARGKQAGLAAADIEGLVMVI